MFEKFNEPAIKSIVWAQEEARRLGHNFVGTEMILIGLIREDTGVAFNILKLAGVNLANARVEVERIIGRGSGFVDAEIPFTPRAKSLLRHAWAEAQKSPRRIVCTEHLLFGLIREAEDSAVQAPPTTKAVAHRVLESLEVDLDTLRKDVLDRLYQLEPRTVQRTETRNETN